MPLVKSFLPTNPNASATADAASLANLGVERSSDKLMFLSIRDQFAAGDEAGNIRIWKFDGKALSDPVTLTHSGGVLTLAYSHDGKWLASAQARKAAATARAAGERWRLSQHYFHQFCTEEQFHKYQSGSAHRHN